MDIEQIQLVEVDFTDLENVEKPEMVYKYRSWNKGDVNSDNVLLKNQLFLAEPSSFVDQFDCKIPTRYDLLTDEEILQWGEPIVRRMHTRWNDKAIKNEVIRLAARLPFKDENKMKLFIADEWKSYNDKSGILSLCKNPLNNEMWKMYGHDHTGICYGYETNKLIRSCGFGGGGPVTYQDELPIIHPLMDSILVASIRVYYKLTKWEFEEEYRIRDFSEANVNKANRVRVYSDDILKEVTLGHSFDDEQIPRIIEILRKKGSHADLYKCEIVDGALSRLLIDY
ncbi:DUF2971 domain-containing protein [Pedobacter sp. ISL-68]|uniref:DUF2971 domain-containing protein n=1 Tax=unclassified Pedobacter TaxID=2628915 RepID=UPI001BE66465|nr:MULTISPECIES: DUF2971 domain-containing protein [unclassified Pedobacter]MBT2561121.1 DUF2971 domain-containing protein [Pedobacter sp. ISL-64]MBT2590510.1 DUF2971 domain-containing protein [Pedobacter sp. ISL-68]